MSQELDFPQGKLDTYFMEKFIESIGWKKIGIAAVVSSVLLLILVILSTGSATKSIVKGGSSPAPVPNSSGGFGNTNQKTSPTKGVAPTINPVNQQTTWSKYQNSLFEIEYPSIYSYESGGRVTGGSIVNFYTADKSTEINVISQNETKNSLQNFINLFKTLNYEQSAIVVRDLTGIKFKGSTTIGGRTLYETAIILQKAGTIYKLQLMQKDQDSTFSEEVFDRMVQSFATLE